MPYIFYFEAIKNNNNFNDKYNSWVDVCECVCVYIYINVLLILKIDLVTHFKKISKIIIEDTCINYFKYVIKFFECLS